MDQLGAFLGPLIVAVTLVQSHQDTRGFAVLAIPAALAIATLFTARRFYPDPARFETEPTAAISATGFQRTFWIYVAAAGLIAAGIADFALVSFHFQHAHIVPSAVTPVFYSVGMGFEAIAALVLGRLFDKHGVQPARFGLPSFQHSLRFTLVYAKPGHGPAIWPFDSHAGFLRRILPVDRHPAAVVGTEADPMKKLPLVLLLLSACAKPPRIGASLQIRKNSPDSGVLTLKVKNEENRPTTPILVEVNLKPSDGSTPLRVIHPAAFVLNRREEREIVALFRSPASRFEPVLTIREAETGKALQPEPLRNSN